ncbi:MAG: hypothetical protein ACO1HP_04600, partial [Bacteroidota bacterium]
SAVYDICVARPFYLPNQAVGSSFPVLNYPVIDHFLSDFFSGDYFRILKDRIRADPLLHTKRDHMVVQSERYDAQRPPCDPVLRQLLRISDKLKETLINSTEL